MYSYWYVFIEHLLWPGTVLGAGNMKVSKADMVPVIKDISRDPQFLHH